MSSDSADQKPEGVLLLGMHRSGTSVLASALGAWGFWLGDDAQLLAAHPTDNPGGYWERSDIHDAHVDYLAARGHDWNRLSGFRVETTSDTAGIALTSQLQAIRADFDSRTAWLIKDPRLSLLLPFWQTIVPEHVCVVAVRHPVEIAASLRRSPRGIYSSRFLLLLWQKYITRMLSDLGDRRVIFVDYNKVIADPERQMSRLRTLLVNEGIDFPAVSNMSLSQVAELFDRRLHRQRAGNDDGTILDVGQRELYRWLSEAASAPDAVTVPVSLWPEPDVELAEFEAASDFLIEHGRAMAAAEVLQRLTVLESQSQVILEQSRAHQEILQNEVVVSQARVRMLEAEQRIVEQKNAAMQIDLSDMRSRLDQERAATEQARRDHAEEGRRTRATAEHAGNLEHMLGEMRRSWSWRIGAPLRAIGSVMSLRLPSGAENALYRLYYRIPGLSAARKRSVIAWLHGNMAWLTRNTVSFQLYQSARRATTPAARDRWMEPLGAEQRLAMLDALRRKPLVSVVMPVHNTEPKWLQRAIASLRGQSYPHWQLCIADDASSRKDTIDALDALDDNRIRIVRLAKNAGIALASNEALAIATGDYVALLDHDDELAPDALLEVVTAFDQSDADYVYTDEDKIDFEGNHVDPHFKPDYSPDYLFSINYLCHLSVMRRDLLERIGGFRPGFDGAQDFDLLLRYLEQAERVVHLPKVLYHWRMHEGSTAAASTAKPKSWDAGYRAVNDALTRREISGRVEMGPYPNTYSVRRDLAGEPLVSVVVPFKDKPELLEACVASVIDKGGYDNFELLAIDNDSSQAATHELLRSLQERDSRIRVLSYSAPFNYSAINNWAVRQSAGDFILFLNNDIEAIADGWMAAMVEQAQREDVGVVGALLLYPDRTVQHSGVIVGLGGVAGHAHLHDKVESPGYFSRLHLIQEMSAVTFACAMTRRDVFERLGGLNEYDLTIAFNDVDFCLRAREHGLKVIYTPLAKLYHFESKSRGYEDTAEKQARFGKEIAYMQRRHADVLGAGDPFYNPNFALDKPSFCVRTQ